jgi:hypothetical protein
MVFKTERAQRSDFYGCIRFAVLTAEGAVALKWMQRLDEFILSRAGGCRILHEQPLQIGRTSNLRLRSPKKVSPVDVGPASPLQRARG